MRFQRLRDACGFNLTDEDGKALEEEIEVDVVVSYHAARKARPKRNPAEVAQGVFKLGNLGCWLDIFDEPSPCCPAFFAFQVPIVLQREADRLLALERLIARGNMPLDPDVYTHREFGMIQRAAVARDVLEAKRIRDMNPKPKSKGAK